MYLKHIMMTFAFVTAIGMKAQTEVPAPQNVYARQVTSLNGEWNYFVDQQEQGYYDYRMNPTNWGYFINAKPQRPSDLVEYDFDACPTLHVPGDWNTQDEQLFLYEGTIWMKKDFEIDNRQQTTDNGRFLLYFGAVNYEAIVYVNGKKSGRHVGGFTPFCYDVTDLVHEGKNFVIVKIDNKRHRDNVPTLIFDWWNYGGITRDVLLVSVPETYIEDYSLQLDKATKGKKRLINFSLKVNKPVAGQEVTLSIPELKIKQKFVTDSEGIINSSLFTLNSSLKLWSPETPKLYNVEIAKGDEVIKDEIGFRTIETRGKQLLLNGKPIFLRGVCSHEETAYTSRRCNSAADADTLLSWARQLGCNFIRLAHYPHNEHAVREAERQGFLLWSEIPVYWTISWQNEETYANAERQLTDMIRRDHNRAAVIIWSLANETPHSDARDKFLGRLAQMARSLDSTRLISMAMEVTGASNYVNRLQDNMNKYVDVVSFNQYIGWYRDVNDAPKMKWEIPYDKPVIISEFGGGAKAGLHGDKGQRWTEEFQENLYRENLAMLDKIEGLAGTCPWVLKDFRSPRRPLPGIQDGFNRKGLFSDQGKRKKAFYVLREWYEEKKEKMKE
ncbi:MAG: beta-glucuronidase [Bacteroidaceae bacterium]|nr:beta-glucuronidase [Bacteroidaceae bacterium]